MKSLTRVGAPRQKHLLLAPLGGIRTRVDDVTGRHPRPLNDQGPVTHKSPRQFKALLN